MQNKTLKQFLFFLSIIVFITGCKKDIRKPIDSSTITIIPQPQAIEVVDGIYTIAKNSSIDYQGDLRTTAEYLSKHLKYKNVVKEYKVGKSNQILLFLNKDNKLPKEAYELTINENGIRIEGDAAGVFYGVQTLIQLLIETEDKTVVPYVQINDNPRFEWRGMHLDVSRHFFDVTFIKKYIDILATHKLNVFHWHLTDDHGWRIAIDKYPKLTEIGAWRFGDGMEIPWDYDVHGAQNGKPKYGGFYTKEDVKEIVAYAQERFVTVVPEIELPGHSWAALHAYPNLSCTGRDWHMGKDWSFSDPFCAGNEDTFAFFENVLTEIIELFPSPYIHIGGDEAQKTKWEHCYKCQAKIKNEGLKDEEELQSYFIKRIEKFITSKGRKIIGWDEILEGGLAPGAAVMSWRGEEGGIAAAKQKHEVIMTPGEILYFNQAQYNPKIEAVEMDRIVDLETVYNYNPIPNVLHKDDQKYIKGVEACLWTEYVYNTDIALKRLLPRLLALSEVAWTSTNNKDWNHFQNKLANHILFLNKQEWNYFISPPITRTDLSTFVSDSIFVELESQYIKTPIYFTVDNSEPNLNSTKYTTPIIIKDSIHIKARVILPSGKESAVFEKGYKKIKYQEALDISDAKSGIFVNFYKGKIHQLKDLDQMKILKKPEYHSLIAMPENMPKDAFGLKFTGYIKISKTGIYTFYTSSDDGSTLSINDKIVVDNDGLHGMQEHKGEVALKKGYHKINVSYFENGGGEGLKVQMKGANIEKREIASELLFRID